METNGALEDEPKRPLGRTADTFGVRSRDSWRFNSNKEGRPRGKHLTAAGGGRVRPGGGYC